MTLYWGWLWPKGGLAFSLTPQTNMMNRRNLLKGAAAVAFGGLLSTESSAAQPQDGPQEWGGWFTDAQGNKHMPVVTTKRDGDAVSIAIHVPHVQNAGHHISYVRIYSAKRVEIASAEFHATMSTPGTTMTLRLPAGTTLFAVSDCNKHGIWYTEFQV
jgi:desulfoferrodoxin (superoxide reductase-like protein)